MSNLIWKEWHEQSWKLAFGTLVLAALALIGLRSRILPDENMLMWVCFTGLTLLPVLSSTGLVPAERSDGGFESLLALPVAPWRILAAKTAMGLLLCAGPMIVAMGVSLMVAGGREMSDAAMLSLCARSTLAAMALFVWMLALTVRLPSEARAGLLGMGILIFWTLATGGLVFSSVPLLAAISPLGLVFDFSAEMHTAPPPWIALLIGQLVIVALLWAWTSTRLTGDVEK